MSLLKTNKSGLAAATIIALSIGFGAGIAVAAQPDMQGALNALQNAQSHLRKVTQNKDGHAAAARNLVEQAITEVQAGIAYGQSKGE
jgi:hypothetical protein